MFDGTVYLNEGMEAGLDGLSRETCPYSVDSEEYALWMEGWRCGCDEGEVSSHRPRPSRAQC